MLGKIRFFLNHFHGLSPFYDKKKQCVVMALSRRGGVTSFLLAIPTYSTYTYTKIILRSLLSFFPC